MRPDQPIPPAASRGDVLGQLQRELWHARQNGETRRVEELTQQIGRLSASTADPQRETSMAAPPQRETTNKPKPPAKRAARKTAARKQTPRSSRVPRQ